MLFAHRKYMKYQAKQPRIFVVVSAETHEPLSGPPSDPLWDACYPDDVAWAYRDDDGEWDLVEDGYGEGKEPVLVYIVQTDIT